ncbi:MAG: arginyltransferase [Thiotrichales bacterium]|nr:arginyltransferase [Thiotrichales bacterium]
MRPPTDTSELEFFATPEHECSYLDEQSATTLFADPRHPKDTALYTVLSQNGFRRSGTHVYRPYCKTCSACVPVRVATREFTPNRAQRRTLKKNGDVRVLAREPRLRDDHFDLYHRYITHRHAGGGMENPTREQFLEFLTSEWSETVFYEFRAEQRLLAVAVTDHLRDGCSAVYTFFEPDEPSRSLGVYTVLWQIAEIARLGRPWLYLGYFINDCRKMSYKNQYHPQEHFVGNQWEPVSRP